MLMTQIHPKFKSVALCGQSFLVTVYFETGVPNDLKTTLITTRSTVPHICTTSVLPVSITNYFALQSVVFELQVIFKHVHQLPQTTFDTKRQNFNTVLLLGLSQGTSVKFGWKRIIKCRSKIYREVFVLKIVISKKSEVYEMPPNDVECYMVKCAPYILYQRVLNPKFQSSSLCNGSYSK